MLWNGAPAAFLIIRSGEAFLVLRPRILTDSPRLLLDYGEDGKRWSQRILSDLLRQQDWVLFLGHGLARGALDLQGPSDISKSALLVF